MSPPVFGIHAAPATSAFITSRTLHQDDMTVPLTFSEERQQAYPLVVEEMAVEKLACDGIFTGG